MPLNGKATPVSKPSWVKDNGGTPLPSATAATPTRPAWARKTPLEKKEEEPKKEVTTRLQSREIKVPLKVEKTIPTTSILKKQPDVNIKQDLTEDKQTLPIRKTPLKSTAKTPSTLSSKSPSTTPSKSPTPSKSNSTTPSKSPSKTPDYDSDEDESSYESETDSSEEETDSDEDFSDDEKPSYKPPSPGALRQHLIIPALKKVSKSPESTSTTEPERSQSPDYTFKKPELKKVITRQKSDAKERSTSPEPKFIKPNLRRVPSSLKTKEPAPREKLPVVELKKAPPKPEPERKLQRKMSEQFPHKPSILRAESNKKIPLPPPPPPPPPPPGLRPPSDFEKKPLTKKRREILEKLKSRPRRRPDWSEMMKEVEEIRAGKKLKHVECNDRSTPIIACKSLAKVQGQYVFETEKKDTELDKLLNQIQGGVKLKPTKTNDRSRPVLDGLRKFRRQMTIEEQILKSESKATLAVDPAIMAEDEEEEVDELDDIDKVRDDLQSTKQMLALELRNKEAKERENKRLMSKIANLEAELERERQRAGSGGDAASAVSSFVPADDVVVENLKKEAEEAQKTSKLLEKKYQESAEQLDNAQKQVEEQKRMIANLEKKLQGGGVGSVVDSRRQSEAAAQKESSPELELELSDEEPDETEEQKVERAARRLKREVDMMQVKLKKLKDKENGAKSDRKSMRVAMRKNQQVLKSEKKKLKKLQKEVEKMAKMMQAVEDEDDEDAEEKVEAEESEQESEESEQESEESESEESDSDTESQSEAEDADDDSKKANLDPRVKRHDARLSSLKKGNYLLEANVERLKDEIKELKEKCEALQADLNSVIDLC